MTREGVKATLFCSVVCRDCIGCFPILPYMRKFQFSLSVSKSTNIRVKITIKINPYKNFDVINPRRAWLQYLVCKSVCPSVCYHVFCHYAQQGGQTVTPMGSVPRWLDFRSGDFRKSTAFKCYGVKYAEYTASPRHRSFLCYNKGMSTLCIAIG